MLLLTSLLLAADLAAAVAISSPAAVGTTTTTSSTDLDLRSVSHFSLSPTDNSKAASIACIDVSLSHPRWEITNMVFTAVNYSQGYTKGDVTFTAHNVALNLTTNCWAEDIELNGSSDAWHPCTVPGTEFQFRLGTYDLKMRGSWDCGDARLMQFKAGGVGNTAGIRRCDDYPFELRGWETRCIMDDSSISAGLSSPVAIEPTQPLLPEIPEARARSCTDRSANPSWNIESFSVSGGSVSVNVTNLSNNQGMACSAKVDSSSKTQKWLDCVDSASTNIVSTGVMFDGEHGILGFKQTWKCPSEPYVESSQGPYKGIAYLTSPTLKCSGSCSVTVPKTTLNGYINAGPGLPHTSYIRSCTLNSFNSTTLTLKSYEIAADTKKSTFNLYNQGSGDNYLLSGVALKDDGAWHDCDPSDGLPWQLAEVNGCKYNLDKAHEKLGFKIKWDCDDRDPLHPIIFEAEASAALPKDASPQGAVELAITSLTWASSKKPMEKGPLLPWI